MPISIQDLSPVGHNLFLDDESYLSDILSDAEFNGVIGGSGLACVSLISIAETILWSIVVTRSIGGPKEPWKEPESNMTNCY
jgi:hypothetical protein